MLDEWEGDDEASPEPDPGTVAGLIDLIEAQKALLISVSTGGPGIDSVDGQYKARRQQIISGLRRAGLQNPFPWRSLWDWYGVWSSGEYPSYALRRAYIRELSSPALEELERRQGQPGVADWGPASITWEVLEERLNGLKTELDGAGTLDELQDVGRRTREIIIDAVNLVFDESMVPADEDSPKVADAKARFDYCLSTRAAGSAHSELRSLLRAAWELAQTVTHSSSVTKIDAFGAAQAAVLLVRTLQTMEAEATPE